MSREPARHQLNGKCRRRVMRQVCSNSRWMHLYHSKVCIHHKMHMLWIWHTLQAQQTLLFLMHLRVFKALIINHIFNPINPNMDITIGMLIQITNIESSCHQSIVHGMFHMDHLLFDITPKEEALLLEFTPCQHIRFQSWDDKNV